MGNGFATCCHCGASLRLGTIFNREMGGLARSWRRKHESACAGRTPAERLRWAARFLRLGDDSSITIDLEHPGMLDASAGRP